MAYAPKKAEGENIASSVVEYGKKLGMSDEEIKVQNKLIEIYLNDCNYCKAMGKTMKVEIFVRPDRKVGFRRVAI